jgi:hypothetical protein
LNFPKADIGEVPLRVFLLKNSTAKFGRENNAHEKAIATGFLSATTFKATLVVKRFL